MMNSLKFEWDSDKNIANQRKHNIAFEEAQTVFNDNLARLIPDPDSTGEQRFILMGMSIHAKLLTVCHCERSHYTIRIISARKADKVERQLYEEYSHA